MDYKNLCKTFNIDEYILGKLSDKEKRAIENHLFNCDSCFQEFQFRKEMHSVIQTEGDILFAEFLQPEKKQRFKKNIFHTFHRRYPSKIVMFKKYLQPVFIIVFLFIVIFSGFFMYRNYFQKDFLSNICYDEQVPYPYEEDSQTVLRSSEDVTKKDAIDYFNNQFIAGILEYRDLDYTNAIRLWQSIQTDAENLRVGQNNESSLLSLRDYYFYFGVTYLAVARSKITILPEEQKQISFLNSAKLLSIARNLASSHQMNHIDRDLYFLALAYSFLGDIDSAVSQLQKIEQDSHFNTRANKLQMHLTKN